MVRALRALLLAALALGAFSAQRAPPPVRDDAEDNQMGEQELEEFGMPMVPGFEGHLIGRWRDVDRRCCSAPAAPLVVDTHMHVWNEDPRPNRGLTQLGLLEDVLTESWGEGVDLGVLVQPGFRGANNTYIERSLEIFPGTLSGEVEAVKDYSDSVLRDYHELGIRGLRFKATSLQKYQDLVLPRLQSHQFKRIARFLRENHWHWGVQLSKEVAAKWKEILSVLQDTEVPIIVDMFGRPDPLIPAGAFPGTLDILEAAARPPPAGKIWMELGAPFRIDPRCTYAEPAAANPEKCQLEDRVRVPRRGVGGNESRILCCPPQTHQLLIDLAKLFIDNIGEDFVVWGTDWPFISDTGVTVSGLLDAVATWVPDLPQRHRVLGVNAVRPSAVGDSPMYPLIKRVTQAEQRAAGRPASSVLDVVLRPPVPVADSLEDEADKRGSSVAWPRAASSGLVQRWKKVDKRCCSSPLAPVVVDTHAHVWDEDPRPNRGFDQLGLLEDVLVEGWGAGVHLAVLVQPGFRLANNSYIARSLEKMPGRLAGEVEAIIDYDDETLKHYHDLGVRGLRFKATSLVKYAALVGPRLASAEFPRIAKFMREHDWHWGVQLSKEAGSKWEELLRVLQETQVPVIVDMFGRPDPAAVIDIGTQAIVEAARRPAPAGKIWVELGGPFRVDPRCTYAEVDAADPSRCLKEDRVNITRRGGGGGSSRQLCCPPSTHELFVRLSQLFATVVGRDFLVWGTDWPFISDQGVTTRGLLDAAASWLSWDGQENEKLLFQVLGSNALRPNAVGNSPLFPLLDLRKRPPLRLAGIFAARRKSDALAFQHAVEEANTLFDLPVVLDGVVHWQNDTNNSLEYFQTACKVVEAGSAAVVGPPSSAQTASMMNILAPLGLPVLGTSASDPMLRRYPNFVRLVPGDNQQSMALAAVMKHFQWARVATVYQMDSYGENGLEAFWDWSLRANGDAFRLPVKLSASVADMQVVLENIVMRKYSIIVANICCDQMFMARLATAARNLKLFDEGFFWIFTDGATNFMETGELGQVMPAIGQRPGLWGVIVDAFVDDDFQAKLSRRFPGQVPHNVSVFSATAYDAVFAVARSLVNLSEAALEALSKPESCLGNLSVSARQSDPSKQRLLSTVSKTRRAASLEALELLRAQRFHGVSGDIVFDEEGSRQGQRFKVLNVQGDGAAVRAGSVEADSGALTLEPGHVPLFLGSTLEIPSDKPPAELMGFGFFGVLVLVLVPLSLVLGCCCECVWRKAIAGQMSPAAASSSPEAAPPTVPDEAVPTAVPSRTSLSLLQRLVGEPEPVHGCPPPTLRRPILGDLIAGGVKAIIELVGCLTFSALMAPEELQPFLPVFLNYALFGFVVSQLFCNFVSRYATPVRTCNISAAIFFLQVLATCREDLAGVPDQEDITVNTMLMAATITTWMSGALLWVVGTFKLTNFVRYLSEPVKLGMQVSLGYFLFATGFSISTGISWLDFGTLWEFKVYFELSMLLKWTITLACALSIFHALNRWSWPYTIPVFVGAGIGIFHVVLLSGGISIEEAKEEGWLYPPPAGGAEGTSAFGFIGRIYDVERISWKSLHSNLPAMGTAALVGPFLSAIINLILFETAFDPEEFGKSTLSYELRMDGLTQWLLAVIGGYSTSPSCGGTAVHRRIGARTNWGLFSATAVHAAFLLVPGSTDVLQFVPKYVVGAVSLIVAITLLDTGLRGGYSKLSLQEYTVVCLTMLMSMLFGIESGIAGGWILSFALFIREAASTKPLRLDVDAGLVSSHAIWGTRSSQIVAQVRGAIRMISFQGVLFFAAVQPMLKEAERRHLLTENSKAVFVILDFSAVTGMDDSSPFEFKNFAVQAKKVGVSIVLSGCSLEVLSKLRKVGTVPHAGDVLELADDQDLLPPARSASAGGGIDGCGFFILGSADRAVEFCEAALALRTLDLCWEVVPKPSRELEALASLVESELAGYRHRLARGETLERKEGEIFILTEGAIEAVVQLTDAASGQAARSEVIVVYRTLPGLPKDYCFSSSTPGVLRAVTDTTFVLLPQGALSQLRHSERWADIEVVWSQLAEFMAGAMHPMAMKATMQDVRGSFTSGAAEAFGQAVYEHRSVEGRNPVSDAMSVQDQKNFLRRLFLGGGARLRELRRSITVGRQPVFASLQEEGSPAEEVLEPVLVDISDPKVDVADGVSDEERATDTRDELLAAETTPGDIDLAF